MRIAQHHESDERVGISANLFPAGIDGLRMGLGLERGLICRMGHFLALFACRLRRRGKRYGRDQGYGEDMKFHDGHPYDSAIYIIANTAMRVAIPLGVAEIMV